MGVTDLHRPWGWQCFQMGQTLLYNPWGDRSWWLALTPHGGDRVVSSMTSLVETMLTHGVHVSVRPMGWTNSMACCGSPWGWHNCIAHGADVAIVTTMLTHGVDITYDPWVGRIRWLTLSPHGGDRIVSPMGLTTFSVSSGPHGVDTSCLPNGSVALA